LIWAIVLRCPDIEALQSCAVRGICAGPEECKRWFRNLWQRSDCARRSIRFERVHDGVCDNWLVNVEGYGRVIENLRAGGCRCLRLNGVGDVALSPSSFIVGRQHTERTVVWLLAGLRINGGECPADLPGGEVHESANVGEHVAEVFAELHARLVEGTIFGNRDAVVAETDLL